MDTLFCFLKWAPFLIYHSMKSQRLLRHIIFEGLSPVWALLYWFSPNLPSRLWFLSFKRIKVLMNYLCRYPQNCGGSRKCEQYQDREDQALFNWGRINALRRNERKLKKRTSSRSNEHVQCPLHFSSTTLKLNISDLMIVFLDIIAHTLQWLSSLFSEMATFISWNIRWHGGNRTNFLLVWLVPLGKTTNKASSIYLGVLM